MGLLEESYISFVNLDHRTDRLQKMQETLSLHNIQATRTRGVLPHERQEEKANMTAMLRRKQVGALGCYLAQIDIMKEALRQNKHAFVMEDDLVFCSDFGKRIEYLNKWRYSPSLNELSIYRYEDADYYGKFERVWDILWLGATFHVGGKGPYWHTNVIGRDAELTNDPRILRTYGSFCTYAYIVNKDSIEKVLALLEQFLPESIGIDHSMINISPKLHTYAFVPGMIKQFDNASDQHEGAFTEFSRFEKLNGTLENSAYWWQDKMEDFDPKTFDWAEANTR